jgi:hypothetical protein
MIYDDARELIKTGDLIAIKNTAVLSRILQYFQRRFFKDHPLASDYADYAHCGIAVWRGDRLHIAEMVMPNNSERALSHYVQRGAPFKIFRPTLSGDIKAAINRNMDTLSNYDYRDFLVVYMRLLLGKHITDDDKRFMCPEFVVRCYADAGADVTKLPAVPVPFEVCVLMHNFFLFDVR